MLPRRAILQAGLALPFLSLSGATRPAFAQSRNAALDALRDAGAAQDQMHSLMVQKGDEVIFARAFRGPGLDAFANIKSCSKSLVSLLLGCAIARGEVSGIDATLQEVAPTLIPRRADPAVATITLGDLASLRAGLERTSGPNYGGWVASSNWVANALSRPMVDVPGGRMLYSTGSTHVLGAALTEASGQSLLAQARARLGTPLGIDIPPWTRDPQGHYMGGNQMALTPRAMLKVGQLVRDNGQFGDEQVIARDWLRRSTTRQTRSPYSGLDYGYGWFLSQSGWVLARGYGGQIIAAHQGRDLAVAITSDPLRPARSRGYFGTLMALLDGPVLAL